MKLGTMRVIVASNKAISLGTTHPLFNAPSSQLCVSSGYMALPLVRCCSDTNLTVLISKMGTIGGAIDTSQGSDAIRRDHICGQTLKTANY